MTVHPHARGEHMALSRLIDRFAGSSPRTWGTHLFCRDDVAENRFIPTHVGNTLLATIILSWETVHPHARGEHIANKIDRDGLVRFIPTHVGNTSGLKLIQISESVHPHARGEHDRCLHRIADRYGSSPRTWGTQRSQKKKRQERRFIPTHVGNTSHKRGKQLGVTVHPHARGEHNCLTASRSAQHGSSPRTWGTPRYVPSNRQRQRFIPTHVGNTFYRGRQPDSASVHPHARGEHNRVCGAPDPVYGSSPRTWGTHFL